MCLTQMIDITNFKVSFSLSHIKPSIFSGVFFESDNECLHSIPLLFRILSNTLEFESHHLTVYVIPFPKIHQDLNISRLG